MPDVVQLDAGPAPVSMSDGARAAAEAEAVVRGLDALVCVSDPVAFGAIMSLHRMSISVPGDIAVTGFGAFEIARIAIPRITTLDVGAERIGTEAGRIVERLRSGTEPDDRRFSVRVEPTLAPGDST